MGGMFSKYKKRVIVSEQVSILNRLKQRSENIIEDQLKTEEAIDMDKQRAKQLLREGRRDEAKTILMRKRSRERQLQRSNAQLDKIDQLTEYLELMTELPQREEEKSRKRGKCKWFSKKPKRRHTAGAENIEIQNLDGFKQNEKQKIMESTKGGIKKQKKIDDAFSYRLRSDEETDEAVEKELEIILHADYQLPEMQEISSTDEPTYENLQGLKVLAETAVGA